MRLLIIQLHIIPTAGVSTETFSSSWGQTFYIFSLLAKYSRPQVCWGQLHGSQPPAGPHLPPSNTAAPATTPAIFIFFFFINAAPPQN